MTRFSGDADRNQPRGRLLVPMKYSTHVLDDNIPYLKVGASALRRGGATDVNDTGAYAHLASCRGRREASRQVELYSSS
jgi:hypothetical protein